MKDSLMEIKFEHGSIKIWHKSLMGKLNDVFEVGNKYRHAKGLPPRRIDKWLILDSTIEQYTILDERLAVFEYGTSKPLPSLPLKKGNTQVLDNKQVNSKYLIAKRGKNGGTYTHLHMIIQAAMWLSPDFNFDVIEMFITNNILKLRDDGGESFKKVNIAIDKVFPSQDNKSKYIKYAQYVREICGYPISLGTWDKAPSEILALRDKELNTAVIILESGLLTDFKQLIRGIK